MSDFQAQHKLWDEFLEKWPASQLAAMTLEDYTKVGSTDTFTYWLEHHLRGLGSIRGGDAIKFGVYARSSKEKTPNHPHSETYVWHKSLNATTANEAFEKVLDCIIRIANFANEGNLDSIDTIEHLWHIVKWKIAFHYQKNRQQPTIVDIFKPEALAAFTGVPTKQGMAALQRATLKQRPEGMDILEFGRRVWETPEVREALTRKQSQTSISAPPTPTPTQAAANESTAPGACINRIYYGPPGTGKTYTVIKEELKKKYGYVDGKEENPRYRFVTFHQSYGYEEFVEGLRPVLNDKSGTGEVQYEIRAGVFKELCDEARKPENADQRFAMVIDEINRGNISKIFGELITLIEPDKREDAPNAVPITLPYSRDSFLVPANVDIIGTMNTADRSLALLDTALRRRFEFVPLLPDTGTLAGLKVGDIDVPKMLEYINKRIEVLYDREHCIGHAYFMALKEDPRLETLANIFRNRILPLLEEYFFEDWHKIRLVLGDNQKPEENQFVRAERQDLSTLFGSDHELDSDTTRRRYSVQESAFDNPAAYIGIYDKPAA